MSNEQTQAGRTVTQFARELEELMRRYEMRFHTTQEFVYWGRGAHLGHANPLRFKLRTDGQTLYFVAVRQTDVPVSNWDYQE